MLPISEFGNAASSTTVVETITDNVAPSSTLGLEDVPHHVRNVAALRGLGFSFREIGKSYGVTPQAASIMLSRHRALMKTLKRQSDLAGLSPRAVNSLGRLGVRTREDACSTPNLEEKLRIQRNCGRKTIDEVLDWVSA